ncbi:hypothetical protein L195_g009947 [Trifolium pratense]|uniref:Uncharacterized protein n=1 Tax=Trifolium pratense TaxID=57577 RepID=A0A2K3PDG2_TRIPR|nr:hypothetical protein L195_g009692 [Trifolium pratense]PNY13295.1 hypothetical protein L195_g009947 [Trifolium pratense]
MLMHVSASSSLLSSTTSILSCSSIDAYSCCSSTSNSSSPLGTTIVSLDCYSGQRGCHNLRLLQPPLLKVACREMASTDPTTATLFCYSACY